MDNRTEPLAAGIWRVEVGYATNAYVLANDGTGDGAGLTVVDPGPAAGAPRLVRSIRLLGLDPRRIGDVVLTHWHAHAGGGAARFVRSNANSRIFAGRADLPAVRGEVTRPQRAARREDASWSARHLGRFLAPGEAVPSAGPLDDGQRLDVAAGSVVVAAPGHTPGSIALHLPDARVLLAGDAVWTLGGVWRGPAALRSCRSGEAATLRRIAALDVAVLAPAHGPPLTRRVRERVAALGA